MQKQDAHIFINKINEKIMRTFGDDNEETLHVLFTFEIDGCIVPLYEAARPIINPTVVLSCSFKRMIHAILNLGGYCFYQQ